MNNYRCTIYDENDNIVDVRIGCYDAMKKLAKDINFGDEDYPNCYANCETIN